MCESGANFLCVHYRLKVSHPLKKESKKKTTSVSLFYSRCICLVADPETFATNQQGGNIQSPSGVRNIQGQDIFFLSVYLIRNHLPPSIHTSDHTRECILRVPYETKCAKAAVDYFLVFPHKQEPLIQIYICTSI